MAKHCDVCNQMYSDDLGACPHCASSRVPQVPPGSESEINLDAHRLGSEPSSQGSQHSSVVDLGQRGPATHHVPAPGSESDIHLDVPRVPDSNSGVSINRIDEPSDSSVIQWSSLAQDAGAIDASGVRVDSPSDQDLLAKAAEGDSSSGIDIAAVRPPADVSGIRITAESEPDVRLEGAGDLPKRSEPSSSPSTDPSGLRITAKSEPDVTPAPASDKSEPDILPPAIEESSDVKLGELPPKKAASDLMLASDALESGAQAAAPDSSDSARGDSGRALVELPADSATSQVSLGDDSASGPGSEQSGLDLTMLSGGSSEGSSILPERPRRKQPPAAEKPARKAPGTHPAIHEHSSDYDDSAVQLGALPARRSDEDEVQPSAKQIGTEQEAEAAPKSRTDAGTSGLYGLLHPRNRSKVLVGAVVGLVLGAGGTAGIMSMFGGSDSKPKTSAAGQIAAADTVGNEWATKFPNQGPDEVAEKLKQLDAAEKNLADQAELVKAEQTKSGNLSNELKTAAGKMTELTEKANAAEKKTADLAAAEEKVKTAEAAARKQADDLAAAVKELKTKVTDAETTGRNAAEQMARLKDELKAVDAKNAAATKQIETAVEARKQAESALDAAARKLKDGKYLKPDAASTDVARAVEQLIASAKTADPSGKMATLQADLAAAQSKLAQSENALAQRWTPQAMLDVWLIVLQQQTSDQSMAKLALADVERVAADVKAGPSIQAKAACVKGLAFRQQGRKDEAKIVLSEALKNAPAEAEWLAAARSAMEDKPRTSLPPSGDVQDGNPLLAEASYMAGVQSYWSGAYERAEEQFLTAIRNDNRDARYHYYLGLTRLSLRKQSAAQPDFERGAELERQGRPSRAAVNAALERIQGSMRQSVERYRR